MSEWILSFTSSAKNDLENLGGGLRKRIIEK